MSAKKASAAVKDRLRRATSAIVAQDTEFDANRQSSELLDVRAIGERAQGDARTLRIEHVVNLADSIAALGLLEPIVVDSANRLLAGGHRLAACRLLATPLKRRAAWLEANLPTLSPDDLERALEMQCGDGIMTRRIPIRRMDFDSNESPDRALAVETAENTQRRNYTRGEIRSLRDRLLAAGFTERRGRPKPGEKPVQPALAVIIGKNVRTIQRALAEESTRPSPVEKRLKQLKSAREKLLKLVDEGELAEFLRDPRWESLVN
jgi:ParB family chromosome partitioning protein